MNDSNLRSCSPVHAVSMPKATLCRATVVGDPSNGTLYVCVRDGEELWPCDWLETGAPLTPPLSAGDVVLVLLPNGNEVAVAIGRVGRYRPNPMPAELVLAATVSVHLRCGASSIDLGADGKVMIRGEDVLIRAKGTQRIRAGTVSIN